MQRALRLLFTLVIAAGLFAPMVGPARAVEAPCPSQVVLECLPTDGMAALARALAALDKPCAAPAIIAQEPSSGRSGEAAKTAYAAGDAQRAGHRTPGIDPPPRSL